MMVTRYAQEYRSQKLHIVEAYVDGSVAQRAYCGRRPEHRGAWRMTINVPLRHACKNCLRVWRAKESAA